MRVAVLHGGRSSEHAVSLASAESAIGGIAAAGHEAVPVLLERGGAWLGPDGMRLALEPGGGLLGADVAFPVLHGPYGEDGTVQGLLELADREFSTIRDRLRTDMTGPSPEPQDDDPRISPRELAAFLAGQYADAGWSRTDHYAWISGLLLELGITSLAELGDVYVDLIVHHHLGAPRA